MKCALLVPLVLVFVGCNTVRPPIEGRADPYVPAQIHFTEDRLKNDTAVGTPIVGRDQAGLLFVTIPIRSTVNNMLHVDYRVTFLDANGVPVGPTLGWFTKTLQANTPDQVTVNSTTPRAADFQVDFRYAR